MRSVARRLSLTERDQAILSSLTHHIKVLAVTQVHKTWWHNATVECARQRLHLLCRHGWVIPIRAIAHDPIMIPDAPLLRVCEDQAEPDWSPLLKITRARWQAPLRSFPAIVASAEAAEYFAGDCRYPRPSEVTHDLFMSGVYLSWAAQNSANLNRWVGEALLVKESRNMSGIVPDALIRSPNLWTAVEVVGASYTQRKLHEFHEHCKKQRWRYELW